MKTFKKIVALMLVVMMLLSVMTACGGGEEETTAPEEEQFVVYTANDLGFQIKMKAALFGICSFDEQEPVYDENFQMNRTSVVISGLISDVTVPLVTISIFEGEFNSEDLETLNPQMVYVGSCEGRTFTLLYSEEGGGIIDDEESLAEYNDVMNNMVAGMETHMTLFAPGTLDSEGDTTIQPPAQLDDETLRILEQDVTPTDLQAE